MARDTGVTSHLWHTLKAMAVGDLLRIDFFIGIAGCAAGITLGLVRPGQLVAAAPVFGAAVGVIIGAVIAGVSIQSVFLDQPFLRKLRAIGRDPVDYLSPFLFTATIGVFALFGLIALTLTTPTAPEWFVAPLGGYVGLLTLWSIASLLPGLGTLIQFIGLRQDALDIPDDIDIPRSDRHPA
ncbi:hypothetical protein RD149_10720 [Gordonia westfalica]|uniref:Uncharacterized protein n=1 Tax=Gordonia westfalica TaxID=158898 RepID=A0ABU2GRZ9_9ACTN|nr:hypothetical protein [Gordonia westfalica]MDS1114242.1 hypothetical protein [Gordonia westfalica]